MADNSKIEWTDATWNPVTGCTKVSPGCDHCYAERIVERFKGKGSFAVVQRSEEKLYAPLKWRTPRRVFVNSMSDLFHDDVPRSFIARVFSVMARTPQHTYQLLTKRHGRMRSLLSTGAFVEQVRHAANLDQADFDDPPGWWPLRNLWLGVSVEDQQWADVRVPALLETPAAVRWLSCEPLLGPIDLGIDDPHQGHDYDQVHGEPHPPVCLTCSTDDNEVRYFRREPEGYGIDWVVVGGESGPGARPMAPAWAQLLRDQCQAARVPFFFKQWGEWGWDGTGGIGNFKHPERLVGPELPAGAFRFAGHRAVMKRVGKKAAGRELDGRTWDEYPNGGDA